MIVFGEIDEQTPIIAGITAGLYPRAEIYLSGDLIETIELTEVEPGLYYTEYQLENTGEHSVVFKTYSDAAYTILIPNPVGFYFPSGINVGGSFGAAEGGIVNDLNISVIKPDVSVNQIKPQVIVDKDCEC